MDLSRLAEQRAQRPDSSILAREDRAAAVRPKQTVTEPRSDAALTRRERRVKEILLKELVRVSGGPVLGGLSYVEKQKLEKRLDVDFIDRELAKMRKHRRWLRRANAVLTPLGVCTIVGVLIATGFFGVDPWAQTWALNAVTLPMIFQLQARALRRKLFIYEALRELSDADETDVVLSRAVEDADRLIREIVEREMALARN